MQGRLSMNDNNKRTQNIAEHALEDKPIKFSFWRSIYFFFKELRILWIAFQHDAVIEEINKNYGNDYIARYNALEIYGKKVGIYSEEESNPYHPGGPMNNPAKKAAADRLSNKLRTYLSNRKALFFAGIAAIFAFFSFIMACVCHLL